MDGDIIGRLGYLGLLLAVIGFWVIVEYRGRLGAALRAAMAWALIFVGAIAGYGLWNDIRSDLMPQQAVMQGGGIEIPRAPDGHFYVTLTVDGQPMQFLADTGATSVVLSQDDAAALGIDPADLVYLGEARTANGIVRTARTTLHNVALGPVVDESVPAYVNEGPMDGSLLGMEYLRHFRIEIDQDRMVLTR